MKCSERLVLDYLDGILESEDQAIFESHMAVCATCRRQLEAFQTTLNLTLSIQPPSLSQLHTNSVVHRVRSQLSRRQAATSFGSEWRRFWAPALSGAIASAVVVIALFSALDLVPAGLSGRSAEITVDESLQSDSSTNRSAGILLEEFDTEESVSSAELALQMEDYLMDTAAGNELFEVADTFVFNYYSLLEEY